MSEKVDIRPGMIFTIQDEGRTVCSAITATYNDGVQLIRLQTNQGERRLGHATEIVLTVIEHHSDVPIYLVPASFGDKPMSDTQLFDWYLSFGFVAEGNLLVLRQKAE